MTEKSYLTLFISTKVPDSGFHIRSELSVTCSYQNYTIFAHNFKKIENIWDVDLVERQAVKRQRDAEAMVPAEPPVVIN